ncbi:MAG: hypothetical protein HQK97_12915 [Nitrospirae bacterium]|nr:hypothetical protein [Nitrospirota bacterium]
MSDHSENHGKIFGKLWDGIHGGYFSNKEVAGHLISAAMSRINPLSPPSTIADLGGGTGFILKELADRLNTQLINHSIRLINIDTSDAQLTASCDGQICTIHCPLEAVTRQNLLLENDINTRLLFLMRFVLHYFGSGGIGNAIVHIRRQMHPGECFIHQSICFETTDEAAVVNELFHLSGLNKWFPSVKQLSDMLDANGFTETLVKDMPALPVTSRDFAERYGIDDKQLSEAGKVILAKYGEVDGVFDSNGSEFTFYLHCRVFISEAV